MDIISQPVEIDDAKIDSRFRFAIAAAERVKQLNAGAKPAKLTGAKKLTTLAIQEVANGSVKVLAGEDALKAREEVVEVRSEAVLDEAGKKETFVEDETELEKDVRSYLKKKRDAGKEHFPWGE